MDTQVDEVVISQEPLFDTGKDPIIEWWDPWDPRLPEVLDRPKTQDFKDMCKSILAGQIYSVIVGRWPVEFGHATEAYELADGRQRVAACRENKIRVRVEVVDINGPEDIIRLRATANFIRSANEAADVLAIRHAVYFEGKNYADVIPGMNKKEAIRLDKKYKDVPDELLVAVAENRCSKSTAMDVAKLKGKAQENILQTLREKGNLKSEDVKEVRAAVKGKAVGTMSWLGKGSQVRSTFDRMEMENVKNLLERQDFAGALEFVNSIL